MKKIILLSSLLFSTLFFTNCTDLDDKIIPKTDETVTDVDGNVYETITIGSQVWMKENLKTTKYNDGTPINLWAFGSDWYNAGNPVGYYQWAATDDLNNVYPEDLPFDFYGAMYNHFAIETGKLAPSGWRIPTKQDFINLENYVAANGQAGNVGTALKSTTGWVNPSDSGTNVIGFNGLPNGYINAFGTATASETICAWATTNVITSTGTRTSVNLSSSNSVQYFDDAVQIGHGIRCIKE